MRPTLTDLLEEINLAAEYAQVPDHYAFTGVEVDNQTAIIKVNEERFLVNTAWALGNIKRLPDRTSLLQIRTALALSHPDTMGLGPKSPPRPE